MVVDRVKSLELGVGSPRSLRKILRGGCNSRGRSLSEFVHPIMGSDLGLRTISDYPGVSKQSSLWLNDLSTPWLHSLIPPGSGFRQPKQLMQSLQSCYCREDRVCQGDRK